KSQSHARRSRNYGFAGIALPTRMFSLPTNQAPCFSLLDAQREQIVGLSIPPLPKAGIQWNLVGWPGGVCASPQHCAAGREPAKKISPGKTPRRNFPLNSEFT